MLLVLVKQYAVKGWSGKIILMSATFDYKAFIRYFSRLQVSEMLEVPGRV